MKRKEKFVDEGEMTCSQKAEAVITLIAAVMRTAASVYVTRHAVTTETICSCESNYT